MSMSWAGLNKKTENWLIDFILEKNLWQIEKYIMSQVF